MRDTWKAFDIEIVDDLCIKYHLLFYKTIVVQFNFKYLVVVSQKNLLDSQKLKNKLFMLKNKNSQNEHYFPSKVAHMCIIWGRLNKLSHDFGHDLAHLA
jgi:hypothetical protein